MVLCAGGLAAALALPACGGGGSGGDANGSHTIEYSWWGSGERNAKTQAVIDLFTKANPNIKIKPSIAAFTDYWERLTVDSAAKGAPCVPQMQTRYMSDYSTRNNLRPLDSLVESGAIDVSGVPKSVLDTGRGSDGKLYMIPTGVFFYAQHYNADLVSKTGATEPSSDWTWEQREAWLRDAAKKLPRGVYGADLYAATDFSGSFFNYVYGRGQKVFGDRKLGFDKQLLVDWWTMWDNLRKDGITTTAQMLGGRPTAVEQLPISQGKILLDTQPANQLTQIYNAAAKAKVGTIKNSLLPKGPSGYGVTLGSNGLSISASCPNRDVDASAKFINFFLNDEAGALAYASDNGTVSVTKLQQAQINDPKLPATLKASLSLTEQMIKTANPQPLLIPVGGRAVFDTFTRTATSVFLGQANPSQAADTFFTQANSALAAGG